MLNKRTNFLVALPGICDSNWTNNFQKGKINKMLHMFESIG